MGRLRLLAAGVVMLLSLGIAPSQPVLAVDPLSAVCAGNSQSATCKSRNASTNPLTGTNGTLYKISSIVSIVAGIAAVFIIIISGVRYMTSGGDTQKTAAAKGTLVGAIIGLVIIALAQTIITFVVRKL